MKILAIGLLASVMAVPLAAQGTKEPGKSPVTTQPGAALLEPTFEDDIRELMKVTGLARQMEANTVAALDAALEDADDELRSQFVSEWRIQMRLDPLEERLIPLYKQYYTHDDVKKLITFYKSPLGQRTILAGERMQKESFAIGKEWGEQLSAKVIAEMDKGPFGEGRRQRRAMGELRSLATATQAWSTDTDHFPDVQDFAEVAPLLCPDYMQKCPEEDPWGEPYEYHFYKDAAGNERFQFISLGADRKRDGSGGRYTGPEKTTSCFGADIVWDSDTFAVRPEGPQSDCK